jgi:hypothetical protein
LLCLGALDGRASTLAKKSKEATRALSGRTPPDSLARLTAAMPVEDTRVIKILNVHRDATPELLRSFFEFHGMILRAQCEACSPPC